MLLPDVSWRERYVSHALNRKFCGVIPTGVYRGFKVVENGDGTVTVDTKNSTAVVESNGYSITVTGDGTPETLTVPDGEWKLVIRANYQIGADTNAEILVVSEAEGGDAVIATAIKESEKEGVTLSPEQKTVIVTESSSKPTLDFGELSIDLGEVDQNYVGEQVDLGEL